ncbi:MAG: hypothetical protein D8M57_13725 [Candidatus Scalindua sp. AMX11]|nr:MAG: hypothetical protein DWQ00_06235 [Candidatus Scalindua sp.]TDE64333.1 MAG: hypothetical protein D8M57_13725 [Candidatus Scalindua sp. AMX11]
MVFFWEQIHKRVLKYLIIMVFVQKVSSEVVFILPYTKNILTILAYYPRILPYSSGNFMSVKKGKRE